MPITIHSWAWALVFVYTLSGMTGLAYEVLWARMLALQFGVSIFGVVASVAAFMAGLGLGSILGARWGRAVTNPLAWFAGLEMAVGLYALTSPWLLSSADAWLTEVAPQANLLAWYALQGSAALLVILLPSLALGAAFTLMLHALSPTPVPLAVIYGLNACGGGLGALLPLWLLPTFGWTNSMRIVAGLGLVVGGTALLLASLPWARHKVARVIETSRRPAYLSLLAYAGVGAAALMLEIGWTRLFGMILLRTEYVIAVILAVFVTGIGLGSLVARPAIRCAVSPGWFTALPLMASAFALLSLWAMPLVSTWVDQSRFDTLLEALLWQGLSLAALTLPVTLALGAWLPLLSARLGDSVHTGPWLYGANSLGAALGAVLAGVLFIPWLGAAGTVCTAALVLFVCGMAWCEARPAWIAVPALAVLAWPVRDLPPVAHLLPEAQAGAEELYQYQDAISITHVVEHANGQRVLLNDLQRMDAATDQASMAVQKNQARLPLLLHPEPHSVLFLGLGTGISAAGSLPFPDLSRVAVELSQGAITAAEIWFAPVNGNVMQEMQVVRDDARRFLRADSRLYDVIIGDLFHPDLVGRSALLSVQQFERARARLAGNGLFVQWLALNQFDAESLEIVLRSFRRVFPEAVVFMDGFRLALVGPQGEFKGAPALLANLQRLSPAAKQKATGGEGAWTWLGRYWGKLTPRPGPVQDEWAPRIEFRLPHMRYRDALAPLLEDLLRKRPDLEEAVQALQVVAQDRAAFDRAYIATELAQRGWLATLNNDDDGPRLMRLAYEANPKDRWIGFALADSLFATLPQALERGLDERQALQRILEVRPDHAAALRVLWHLERAAGNGEQAAAYRTRLREVSPLDGELRTMARD